MKIIKVAIIILLLLTVSGLAYAAATSNISTANQGSGKASSTASRGAGIKAERGIKNILFGWTEIPKSIIQVTRDSKNPIWGLTGGTIKGLGKAFPRTMSGAADLVSFPIADYEKMPIKPDEIDTQIK